MLQINKSQDSRINSSSALRWTGRLLLLASISLAGAAAHPSDAQTCILEGMVKALAAGPTERFPEAGLNLMLANQTKSACQAVMNEPDENKFANSAIRPFGYGSESPVARDEKNERHDVNLRAEIGPLIKRKVLSEANAQRTSRDQSWRRP